MEHWETHALIDCVLPGRPLTSETWFAHMENGCIEWEPPSAVLKVIDQSCKEPTRIGWVFLL